MERLRRAIAREEGVVLPLTLVILLILSSLVMALLAMGGWEPQISANLLQGTQALFVAEAGAERAIAQFVATPSLVSNAPPTCPTPAASSVVLGTGTAAVTYSCDAGSAAVRIDSTGSSSVGTAQRSVRIIVTTAFVSDYAILADEVEISGNGRVQGTKGAVHGNTKTEVEGSAFVEQTATSSSGECEGCTTPCSPSPCDPSNPASKGVGVSGASGAGKPTQTIPAINPMDYQSKADFILQNDGKILVVATGALVNENTGSFVGWKMDDSGEWKFSGGTTPLNGTYYASKEIKISASPGTAETPWKATLLAGTSTTTGEVEIEGHPIIVPYLQDVLIVAGKEVELKGSGGDASLKGAVLSGGEVELNGSVTLTGNVVSSGEVEIKGNATVIYDAGTRTPLTGPLKTVSWSTTS
jgi:Tfp pilus assembly protein PilX